MNWEAIGAVGEILGALAVVATLGYLAVQIRQNTNVARSSTRQAIAEMTMQAASDLVGNKEIADLFIRDLAGEDLNPAERVRIMARHYMVMRNYENIHYQYLNGMLAEDEWQGLRLNIKANFEWKSLRDYWANEQHFYSEEFQNEIVRVLNEISSGTSTYDYITRSRRETSNDHA